MPPAHNGGQHHDDYACSGGDSAESDGREFGLGTTAEAVSVFDLQAVLHASGSPHPTRESA